jgi:hypothetical protein
MRFAHLKVQHGFERMRLRGLTGARDEFHLAAIVQNLKTMALRLLGPPTRGARGAIAQEVCHVHRGACRWGSDVQLGISRKKPPDSKTSYATAFFDSIGQTEKYSKRADIFRSSADNRHPRRPFG